MSWNAEEVRWVFVDGGTEFGLGDLCWRGEGPVLSFGGRGGMGENGHALDWDG